MKSSNQLSRSRLARTAKYQGMNWITQHKRLAIYLRDGLACAWCGVGVEDGAQLSLDHLQPHSLGGTNAETNLVTCCSRCNSSRGNRPVAAFARAVASYINHGTLPKDITSHICRTVKRALPLAEAKVLIAQRGSAAKVLAAKNK